jgi:hypothetical protein
MKFRLLYLILLFYFSTSAQSNLAFIKQGLKTVYVYDSLKSAVINKENEGTYFHVDTLIGNWYFVDKGFISKDSIQLFRKLTKQAQRRRIT